MRNFRNPSPSQYQFSLNPRVDIPRCSLIRPFCHKTTINSGYLYPLYVEEVLPGDTFNVNASIIARLTTPIVPFMDNLYLDMHFFYVPWRLVWDNWVKMNGEQKNPGDSIDYTMPYLVCPVNQPDPQSIVPATYGVDEESLPAYMGIPIRTKWNNGDVHSLFFRAYNLIWNEWYRDENLQNSAPVPTGNGPDTIDKFPLRKRNKRKDYFTSALPWPQKGDSVALGITGGLQVFGNGSALGLSNGSTLADGTEKTFNLMANSYQAATDSLRNTLYGLSPNNNNVVYEAGQVVSPLSNSSNIGKKYTNGSASSSPTAAKGVGIGVSTDPAKSGLIGSLSNAGFDINSLRTAFQIQKLLERSARGGTRYVEILQSFFGVTSPDIRLARPELLGTFSIPVSVNSVAQTSGTDSGGTQETPQGNLAAFAAAAGMKHCFDKSFIEHGCVIGLVSIRSDLTYQQGIPRMFSRRGRYDFYLPPLAHLGEQAILNKEIFLTGVEATDNAAFGYQERWSEYKYSVSRVSGFLNSNSSLPLDYWHLAQDFTALPTLSSSFIEENPPVERILAVTDGPQFVVDSFFHQNCVRPMPLYSIPGLIDHF